MRKPYSSSLPHSLAKRKRKDCNNVRIFLLLLLLLRTEHLVVGMLFFLFCLVWFGSGNVNVGVEKLEMMGGIITSGIIVMYLY